MLYQQQDVVLDLTRYALGAEAPLELQYLLIRAKAEIMYHELRCHKRFSDLRRRA
jgi:hypothetical protein